MKIRKLRDVLETISTNNEIVNVEKVIVNEATANIKLVDDEYNCTHEEYDYTKCIKKIEKMRE